MDQANQGIQIIQERDQSSRKPSLELPDPHYFKGDQEPLPQKIVRRPITFKSTIRKAIKSFFYGAVAKLIYVIIQKKLNLISVLKNFKPILRFGLMVFSLSFLYKITRLVIKKAGIKISRDLEVFISASISSLSLFLADSKDMNLLKVMIFPRAIEALYALLKERGIIKPIKNGEYMLLTSLCIIVTYFYIHELSVLQPSMMKAIDSYMNLGKTEQFLRHQYQIQRYNAIKEKYANNRLL
ncbi:UNKNOWN [Stylonychia lemnae]|uniref:Transmembrane protein n=1 Tax=Stylonychia lemnae TaxID=5949 RepID=A0A078AXE0_STYLE|nr:UNKNOWN [Stylonychia lemnae]|eukprot:CDW86741.1 UNKNOWN [Stylonychia lemnae]